MTFDDFLSRRADERDWLHANGYENANMHTNGEAECVAWLGPRFDLHLDIGSNAGDFARLFREANRDADLHLFEPNPTLSAKLDEAFPGATVHDVALCEDQGEGELFVHSTITGASALHPQHMMMPHFQDEVRAVKIKMTTLDLAAHAYQLLGKPFYAKIDVQGHELDVLRGGAETLNQAPAAVLHFEYGWTWREAGQALRSAFYFLDGLGYELHRMTPYGLEHCRFFGPEQENDLYCNYVATRGVSLGHGVEIPAIHGRSRLYRYPVQRENAQSEDAIVEATAKDRGAA